LFVATAHSRDPADSCAIRAAENGRALEDVLSPG